MSERRIDGPFVAGISPIVGPAPLPCGCTLGRTPDYVRKQCGCLPEPRSTYHIFRVDKKSGKRRCVDTIAGVTEAEKNVEITRWMQLRWTTDAIYVSERVC